MGSSHQYRAMLMVFMVAGSLFCVFRVVLQDIQWEAEPTEQLEIRVQSSIIHTLPRVDGHTTQADHTHKRRSLIPQHENHHLENTATLLESVASLVHQHMRNIDDDQQAKQTRWSIEHVIAGAMFGAQRPLHQPDNGDPREQRLGELLVHQPLPIVVQPHVHADVVSTTTTTRPLFEQPSQEQYGQQEEHILVNGHVNHAYSQQDTMNGSVQQQQQQQRRQPPAADTPGGVTHTPNNNNNNHNKHHQGRYPSTPLLLEDPSGGEHMVQEQHAALVQTLLYSQQEQQQQQQQQQQPHKVVTIFGEGVGGDGHGPVEEGGHSGGVLTDAHGGGVLTDARGGGVLTDAQHMHGQQQQEQQAVQAAHATAAVVGMLGGFEATAMTHPGAPRPVPSHTTTPTTTTAMTHPGAPLPMPSHTAAHTTTTTPSTTTTVSSTTTTRRRQLQQATAAGAGTGVGAGAGGVGAGGTRQVQGARIPRIIHQIFFPGQAEYLAATQKPNAFLQTAWRDSCRIYHPQWSYIFWNISMAEALIHRRMPSFLPAFRAYPTDMYRSDAFRYIVLNELGGLYLDLDVECWRASDPFLQGSQFVVQGHGTLEPLANGMIGSIPKHPIWTRVMEKLTANAQLPLSFMEGDARRVLHVTGPRLFSAAVMEMLAIVDQPTLMGRHVRPELGTVMVWPLSEWLIPCQLFNNSCFESVAAARGEGRQSLAKLAGHHRYTRSWDSLRPQLLKVTAHWEDM